MELKQIKETLKEVNELRGLLLGAESKQQDQSQSDIYSNFIGKYVICRTRNEGVNAGRVKALDDTGVILEECRRLYYHRPLDKSKSWYEGIAQSGISTDSKASTPTTKLISEDYSLTLCTDAAMKTIVKLKDHEQS